MNGIKSIQKDGKCNRQIVSSEVLIDGRISYEMFSEMVTEENVNTYGVRITSSLEYDAGVAEVADITDNQQYARQLFERLICYIVTPSVLVDVVEDFLYEKYSL